MSPKIDVSAVAGELLTSYDTGTSLAQTLSERMPNFDVRTAYEVEAEFRRLRIAEGRTISGLKVGYANKAMWRVLKLETLVWAAMYDDTVHDGCDSLRIGGFIAPRVEPEIVFKMKQRAEGDLDAARALGCVEWMALGYEVIDCPFPRWHFKPEDFVAAYGLHRALVVGEHRPVGAGLVDALAAFKLKLFRNGEQVQEGGGKNSLRSPALCLAEIARAADGIEAGWLISTGTLTEAQPIIPGDRWRAEADGLPVPALELHVT
jgi:2-oxo-3-hexenedioate decarboxylase